MQKTVCLLILLLCCPLLQAEAKQPPARQLLIVDLQQAHAADVLPALEPHLSSRVSLSAQQQRLFLTGPAQELEQLAPLIAALDQSRPIYQLHLSAGPIDKTALQTGHQVYRGTRRNQSTRLTLLAGEAAHLERGFWLPVEQINAWGLNRSYQWLAGGVWVLAEPRGKEVLLAFSSRQLQPSAQLQSSTQLQPSTRPQGQQDWQVTEVATRLRLTPGQWVLVAEQGEGGSSAGTTARSQQKSTRVRELLMVCIGQEEHPCPMTR